MVSGEGQTTSGQIARLQVRDSISKQNFLIDSGTDVSILPPTSKAFDLRPTAIVLYAANGSPIRVSGERSIKVDLGLRCEFFFCHL